MIVAALAWTVVGAVLTLVALPRLVFPTPPEVNDTVERFCAGLVLLAAVLMPAGLLLAALGLFQWIGIVLVLGVAAAVARRRRGRAVLAQGVEAGADRLRAALYVIEGSERIGNADVRRGLREWRRSILRLRRPHPSRAGLRALSLLAPLLVLLAAGVVLRVAYPVRHVALASVQSYRHLVLMANLHNGRVFPDGVSPAGFDVLVASMSRLVAVPATDLLRFGGALLWPVTGLICAVMTVRATRHAGAGLAAAAGVVLLGLARASGISAANQIDATPEVLATLLAAATALLALEWAREPTKRRRLHVGAGALAVALTYPPALALVLFAAVVAGAVSPIRRGFRRLEPLVAAVAGTGLAAAVCGIPVALGTRWIGWPAASDAAAPGFPHSLAIAGFVGALVVIALSRRRGRRPALAWLVAIASSPLLLASRLGVPTTIHVGTASFAILPAPEAIIVFSLGVGVATYAAHQLARRAVRIAPRSRVRTASAVAAGSACVVLMLAGSPPAIAAPSSPTLSYEPAARLLARQVAGLPDLSYTVIGPPVWTDSVVGRAFRADLASLSAAVNISDAADPSFAFPVPSDHALVLIERHNIVEVPNATQFVEADIYRLPSQRQLLMTRVDHWLKVYATYHRGVHVVYEDADVRIWSVDHQGDPQRAKTYNVVGL